MGRPEECARLLKQGSSPAAIAADLQITTASAIDYLYRALGKDYIWLSDIAFSIPRETRDAIEDIISGVGTTSPGPIDIESRRRGIYWVKDEFRLYLRLRQNLLGDLYYFISYLEETLHYVIQLVLSREYGTDAWWERGVPESIRNACIKYRSSDPDPSDHAYVYTQFSHLRKILDDQWPLFAKYLPRDAIRDKDTLLADLQRACMIRNRVMHPIRHARFDEDEFHFIRDLRSRIEEEDWESLLSGDDA